MHNTPYNNNNKTKRYKIYKRVFILYNDFCCWVYGNWQICIYCYNIYSLASNTSI